MLKFPDSLIGKKVGKLTVKKLIKSYIPNYGNYYNYEYLCECSCGGTRVLNDYEISFPEYHKIRDCGGRIHKGYIDLTGMNFGKLKIVEKVSDNQYRCECSCGNEIILKDLQLTYGAGRVSCGKCSIASNFNLGRPSLIGRKFGELTVKEFDKTDHKKVVCECSCGRILPIRIGSLVSKRRIYCGMSHFEGKDINDFIGKKVNRLKIKEIINNHNVICECDCGNEKSVQLFAFLNGQYDNCGKCRSTYKRYSLDFNRNKLTEDEWDKVRFLTSIERKCRGCEHLNGCLNGTERCFHLDLTY